MYRYTFFLTSAPVGGELSASRTGRFTPGTHWIEGWVDPRVEKYCGGEKINLDILTDFQVLSPPEYEKVVSGIPSTCLYICMYASLASERVDGFTRILYSRVQPL
jgi:hypothetical protein